MVISIIMRWRMVTTPELVQQVVVRRSVECVASVTLDAVLCKAFTWMLYVSLSQHRTTCHEIK